MYPQSIRSSGASAGLVMHPGSARALLLSPDMTVQVRHIYERDARKFEEDLNEALARIVAEGGIIGDVKYVSDPASEQNRLGGFGALVLYELPQRKAAPAG